MERSSRKHRDSDRDSNHHHRSKHRDTDGDDRRRRSERDRSEDSYDREGSKDRHHHHHSKRKDRDSDDEDRYYEARDKRVRVSDERKERRRFEDKVAAAEDDRDREERKERRKFDDKVKKEEHIDDVDINMLKQKSLNGDLVMKEVKDESIRGSNANVSHLFYFFFRCLNRYILKVILT